MRNVRDGIVFSVEQFSRSGHSLLGNILMNCGIELLAKTLFKRGFIGAYSACELSNRWGECVFAIKNFNRTFKMRITIILWMSRVTAEQITNGITNE